MSDMEGNESPGPAREGERSSSHVTLFLCGDVMTGRGVDQVLPSSCAPHLYEDYATSALDYVELAENAHGPIPRRVGWRYVWGEALAVLDRERPHARIINLETSITTSEDAERKGINYRMHPDNVPVLTAAGIDCCVLANNHVLDWGQAGLLETLDVLDRARIRVAGAGAEAGAAEAPAVLELGGARRVVVVAFGSGDSGIPPSWAAGAARPGVHRIPDLSDRTVDRIAELVGREKRAGDVAVASVHWGPNWGFDIPGSRRRFAHALINHAQIDIVHGHSSHHPMAIELHRGRPIFYGCGDFLNDYEGIQGYEHYRGDLALMYFPTLDADSGRLVGLRMAPLQIRNFRLRQPPAADRAWLRDTLDRECRRFGHRVTLRDDGIVLEPG